MLLCSPDQNLKQLEQMQGDILCCSRWNLVPGSISMTSISTSGSWNTATLPETLSQWKLKVLFPHVRILKEMATMNRIDSFYSDCYESSLEISYERGLVLMPSCRRKAMRNIVIHAEIHRE